MYISFEGTSRVLMAMNSDGTGSPIRLLGSRWLSLLGGGAVGEWLVINAALGATSGVIGGRDVYGVRPGIDTVGTALLADPEFDETHPALSPDGRWLAYASSETGRFEVYIRPFPNVQASKLPISAEGGSSPLWSRDGRQLFFLGRDRTLMAVDIESGETLGASLPRRLMTLPPDIDIAGLSFSYDVASDGRFVMGRRLDGASADAAPRAIRVDNFFQSLQQQVPR
jgi:serine/threonine-protein kinase